VAYGPFDKQSVGPPTPLQIGDFVAGPQIGFTINPERLGGGFVASATGVRLTLKFNFSQLIRIAGWSESYDMGFATLAVAITNIAAINAFIKDRCNCLGIGPYCVSATLSQYVQPIPVNAPPIRRSTLALPVPAIPAAGFAYNLAFVTTPDGKYQADFAPTVLYISMQTSLAGVPVYRRNLWLAGLPDGSDQTNSGTVTEANTLAALNKFLADLNGSGTTLGAGCGIAIRSIDRSGANPLKGCTGWDVVTGIYTVPAHGFQVNQPIVAEGMKTTLGGFCPKGRYLVASVPTADSLTLLGAKLPTAPKKFGAFRAAIVTFNGVTNVNPLGFTKRDKGRPSGLSVGRQPRKTTLRA
jgi:hypothetical protein